MAEVQPDIIDGKAVRSLVQARAIQGATILGRRGGWAVLVRYGNARRAVAAQRSRRIRLWRNLDTAVAFIREALGLQRFDVDAAGYDPGAIPRKRPDQAERLRRQRDAAEYDGWFRAQVQIGLDAIDRGEVVSHEEAEADFERMLRDR